MISRRALVSRLPLVAVGGVMLYLLRDRIPWPPPAVRYHAGRATAWTALPQRASLIELDAEVNGIATRVVVDTGAQFSAIDKALAQRLDLPQTALPIMAYGVTGEPSFTFTVKVDLALPGMAIRGLRAAALDIARLSAITGRSFSMLLGRDVLNGLVLDADFPRDRVRFRASDDTPVPPGARVVPLGSGPGGAPTVAVRIEGRPVQVMVDTGATGALALSAQAARRLGLLDADRTVRSGHSVSLGGLSLDRIVLAETLELAGITLRRVPVQIYDPAKAAGIPEGLLGTGFLRGFRTTIDLPARRMILSRGGLSVVPPP